MIHKRSILIFMLLYAVGIQAQASENAKIFFELKKMDSILFQEGFNKCNLFEIKNLLDKNFEFYHDQNGIQNTAAFLENFEESICRNPKGKPIRKLIRGSLQVYPLQNEGKIYGAVQTGAHDFYMQESRDKLRFTESANFIATWLLENGQWKLSKEISYNHHKPKRYDAKFEDGYPFPLFDKDTAVESLIKKLKIPSLSIGYIHDGKLQQLRSFGQQKPNVPVSYNSIYKVASLTKPVTAMVTLKLVESGKWDLDTPIADYYTDPELKGSPYLRRLTTRFILSHTSGLPNWRYLRTDKKLVFEFEPGTKFQYSGEGYEYLRKALEKKFEKNVEKLADEVLFSPLKMHQTHYYWTNSIKESRYAVESDRSGQPISYQKHTQPNAAANLLTTVEDYGIFLTYILKGSGLSPSLFQDFLTPHSKVKPGIYWGLGMQILPDLPDGEFALQHTGGDDGTKCIALLLPKSKRGLIIFINSENGLIIWKKIIEEYLGEAGKEIVRRNIE